LTGVGKVNQRKALPALPQAVGEIFVDEMRVGDVIDNANGVIAVLPQRGQQLGNRRQKNERHVFHPQRGAASFGDLDEPFEGLAPTVVLELFKVFDQLRSQASIVIVEHNLDLVLALAAACSRSSGGRCFTRDGSAAADRP
jgi:ABC-type lipopolysaccharide export system ATPase subunit